MSKSQVAWCAALLVGHGSGALVTEYQRKFSDRGVAATFVGPEAIPDPLTLEREYALVVALTSNLVGIQVERTKARAEATNLPFLAAARQLSPIMGKLNDLLLEGKGRKEVLLEMYQQTSPDHPRPWGWVRSFLRHPALNGPNTPKLPAINSTQEFREWVLRLPPEELPEQLRGLHKPPPALPPPPPSDRSGTSVKSLSMADAAAELDQLRKSLSDTKEELTMVKAEYDKEVEIRKAFDESLVRVAEERTKLQEELAAAQANIKALSERGAVVSPKLVQGWKEEGKTAARSELEPAMVSLNKQVQQLQRELAAVDQAMAEAEAEKTQLADRLQKVEATAFRPKNLSTADTAKLLQIFHTVDGLYSTNKKKALAALQLFDLLS